MMHAEVRGENAMVERIASKVADRSYETILAISATFCFVSLLLAATV